MENSKFQEKIFDKLEAISRQLTQIETHASYTKQGVKENKSAIEKNTSGIATNTSDIKTINERNDTIDKVVWEILKPPLKSVGVGIVGFIAACVVGGWLLFR